MYILWFEDFRNWIFNEKADVDFGNCKDDTYHALCPFNSTFFYLGSVRMHQLIYYYCLIVAVFCDIKNIFPFRPWQEFCGSVLHEANFFRFGQTASSDRSRFRSACSQVRRWRSPASRRRSSGSSRAWPRSRMRSSSWRRRFEASGWSWPRGTPSWLNRSESSTNWG